jgi:hypothetical protein
MFRIQDVYPGSVFFHVPASTATKRSHKINKIVSYVVFEPVTVLTKLETIDKKM